MGDGEINIPDSRFYEDAAKYWSEIPPTLDGMLGGFGFISEADIQMSKRFLQQMFALKDGPGRLKALDCGSGIGRVTKNLLIPLFQEVDMVEQNAKFLEGSKSYIGKKRKKIGKQFPVGLQDFVPENHAYDVIWCQWVLSHLKDDHLVAFMKRCKEGLKNNGLIIAKENVTSSNEIEIDNQDSSVTRPLPTLLRLFTSAGLNCIKLVQQTNFPKGLYAVFLFALAPDESFKSDLKIADKSEPIICDDNSSNKHENHFKATNQDTEATKFSEAEDEPNSPDLEIKLQNINLSENVL